VFLIGLVWSRNKNYCDWPESVDCKNGENLQDIRPESEKENEISQPIQQPETELTTNQPLKETQNGQSVDTGKLVVCCKCLTSELQVSMVDDGFDELFILSLRFHKLGLVSAWYWKILTRTY